MKCGTAVLYIADPLLYGVGEILHCAYDGRLGVEFRVGRREYFDPHELIEEREFDPAIMFADLDEVEHMTLDDFTADELERLVEESAHTADWGAKLTKFATAEEALRAFNKRFKAA